MRLFIYRIGWFLLPVIAALFGMELLLRHVPNDYKLQKEYLEQHAEDIEVLILGSSHTYQGVNPKFFDHHTFNMAYFSQTLELDLKILQQYILQLQSLKYVIISVDYFSLFSMLSKSPTLSWRMGNYYLYYNILPPHSDLMYQFETLTHGFKSNLSKLKKYYWCNETLITASALGYGDIPAKKQLDLIKDGQDSIVKQTDREWRDYQQLVTILEQIVQLAKEHDIKLILITTPGYNSYTQNLDKKQLEATTRVCLRLAQQYQNCQYFNFLQDSKFKAEDFCDASHLSSSGAEKLSRMLNEIIMQDTTKK